jgi:hypothetical protein
MALLLCKRLDSDSVELTGVVRIPTAHYASRSLKVVKRHQIEIAMILPAAKLTRASLSAVRENGRIAQVKCT